MAFSVLALALLLPLKLHAQELTVSQCVAKLTTKVFDLKEAKAKEFCKKYSAKAIDCALELKRAHPMSHTLDSALDDCDTPANKN